jgi:AcrR family transcriptional regulator
MKAAAAPKERVDEAKKEAYRAIVLEAAERVFAAEGYDGARMQDIASEAGLALATLYAAAGGKEALYGAIHEARGEALIAEAAAHSARARSPREALRLGVEAYVGFLAKHPDYLRIHLKESQPWALSPRFRTDTQRRQWRQGLELCVLVFRAGIAEGTFVAEDPERMARLMIATHQVFLVDWVEEGMSEPIASLVCRMVAHLERAFLAP